MSLALAPMLALALVAGLLIGLSLSALGSGGSILAVPVLLQLGQSAEQATTGSLVVVGITAALGAMAAHRRGSLRLGAGVLFGAVAIGGAALGARVSTLVPESALLGSFAALMLLVGTLMLVRQRRPSGRSDGSVRARATLDDPIITFRDGFVCDCPRALKVLLTATGVGAVTGFVGVGGGFLVVPALVLALGLTMEDAIGTSLLVIAVASTAALTVRVGAGVAPDWSMVLTLTLAAAAGSALGSRVVRHVSSDRLTQAFTLLVLVVGVHVAVRAL